MTDVTHKQTVFADYFQFVVMDEQSDDDFSTLWTDEAFSNMLAWTASSILAGSDIHDGRRIDSSEMLPVLTCCLT